MSSVMTPPRPPAAKPNGNGNGNGAAHAASKPNGNGSVGYSKQDAEQLRAMILASVAKGEMTVDQAAAELRELVEVRAAGGRLYLKVSPKGAVSIYGLNVRFPLTAYADQWERLFDFIPEIKKFIAEHNGELKRKQRG